MDTMFKFSFAYPQIICFEGGGDDDVQDISDPADSAGDDGGGAGQQTQTKQENLFTQEQLNKFLAEDRRKREQKLKSQEQQVKKVEEKLAAIASQAETTKEQKAMLEAEIEDLRASRRTEQEQREHLEAQRKEKHEGEIQSLKDQLTQWETLYKSSTIERALTDAAVTHDAFSPRQIVKLLKDQTQMKEVKDSDGNVVPGQFTPKVAVQVKEEDGTILTAWKTPEEAVEIMKNSPDEDGNLFRSAVIAGIGGGTAASTGTNSAKIDPKKLSMEEFARRFKEDPESLGLPAKTS